MDKEVIQKKLLEFIARTFMVDAHDINLEKSLIDEGIIDSFGLVEIATFIESEFVLVVEEDEMIRDNFGSVLRIVDFIFKKINQGHGAQALTY
jgi:acyl carrier protein